MITLKKSNGNQFDGYTRHYHNNVDILDWKRSNKTDATQKIALRIIELYLTAASNGIPIEKRVYIQNPSLSMEILSSDDKPEEILYQYDIRTVQKAINYLTDMGIIKHMIYEDLDGKTYKWTGGTKEDWQNKFAGLTNRYIVLDIVRAKKLFAITHNNKIYKESNKRGRLRRLVMRRPFSLKELGQEIEAQQRIDREDKVQTIRERRSQGYDQYLKIQLKRYGQFSELTSLTKADLELDNVTDINPDYLKLLNNFIGTVPLKKGLSS